MLTLSERDQESLRALLEIENEPGARFPGHEMLRLLARLVPADALGVVVTDSHGETIHAVDAPAGYLLPFHPVCDGQLELGLKHQSRDPFYADILSRHHLADGIFLGVRSGRGGVAQIWFDRRTRAFSQRDLSMLTMIAPAVMARLREATTPRLPDTLTLQERRTLLMIASGLSNAEAASELQVATSTVRKHLEHAYRKLGVSSRLAAATVLLGHDHASGDLLERVLAVQGSRIGE